MKANLADVREFVGRGCPIYRNRRARMMSDEDNESAYISPGAPNAPLEKTKLLRSTQGW